MAKREQAEREKIIARARQSENPIEEIKRQLKIGARVLGIALLVIWLLALGFASGLESHIPYFIAGGLTLLAAGAVFWIRRNFNRSRELSAMIEDGADLSKEAREERIRQLESQSSGDDASRALAKAQLEMHESIDKAIQTLEAVNLEKAQKLLATQVQAMLVMLRLNTGDVTSARKVADAIDLKKVPDAKVRAGFVGIIAEAWARSGNPIEASELLDQYDPKDQKFRDSEVQLIRARAFASAHKNDHQNMKKSVKELNDISPQLLAAFVSQKRVHPLLQQEARKRLEKSGMMPKAKIQFAR